MKALTSATAPDYLNQEIACTDWLTITQDMVDGFAHATLDPDWMHIDVDRSRHDGPFGGTIAQGFLLSSLVIYFSHRHGAGLGDAAYALNYGIDRARYIQPVLTGSRVRDRIVLMDFRERGEDRYLMKTHHTIELEGVDKPAAVVDWLVLYYRRLDY